MIHPKPIALERGSVRLEPMSKAHISGLQEAARDGALWDLWFTVVPAPDEAEAYVAEGLQGLADGHMLPWVVRDVDSGAVIGSTRYHDILAGVDRVEIGYTWYADSRQRSHVNTTCKLMLFEHAFETLGCKVVGLRTDNFNFRSQKAIEALGAKKDGVIRHHKARRDGTVRDTHMYSVLLAEWPDVKRHLELRLQRHSDPG